MIPQMAVTNALQQRLQQCYLLDWFAAFSAFAWPAADGVGTLIVFSLSGADFVEMGTCVYLCCVDNAAFVQSACGSPACRLCPCVL
jgi:hypothetical protein